ncbi:MAG TPA: hypothetical protein VLO11_08240 [Luteolibacter sp.]|nr:hypothetical protein [Luteolibacter sp.]
MSHWMPALFAAAISLTALPAHAQLAASLKIPKKSHLTGEPVIAVVTITNHSGLDLTLHSDGRYQWLDFMIKRSDGSPVNIRKRPLFGPMKIAAGQTMAREVDLSEHFLLHDPGNFTVTGVVKIPGQTIDGTSTNRAFFSQINSRPYWSQKVGVRGGNTREFRLIQFAGDSKIRLFTQIVDGKTGQYVRTFPLGEILTLRKPLVTVDRQQRMHVMFLATPTMWVHCVVDTDGRLVNRQIHRRPPQGDPKLITLADGSVQVVNSIPYDPKAEAERRAATRKASERPAIPY